MRILVTGASGLLGSNVALEAVKKGHTVFGVTNRSPLITLDFNVLTANLLRAGEIDRLLEHLRVVELLQSIQCVDGKFDQLIPPEALPLGPTRLTG